MVGANLKTARDQFLAWGCEFRYLQPVFVRPLVGKNGSVNLNNGDLSLDRDYVVEALSPSGNLSYLAHTAAHEMTHVFQWVNVRPNNPEVQGWSNRLVADLDRWWAEGTADYSADVIYDTDLFYTARRPWSWRVTGAGLRQIDNGQHVYRLSSFYKSLSKQRGGINVCDLFEERRKNTPGGYQAHAAWLGGSENFARQYVTYAAVYNVVRDENLFEDLGLFTKNAVFREGFYDRLDHQGDLTPRVWYAGINGAQSVVFQNNSPEGSPTRYTISVELPDSGFYGLLHDADTQELLGELRPSKAELSVDIQREARVAVTLSIEPSPLAHHKTTATQVSFTPGCEFGTGCLECTAREGCQWCAEEERCIGGDDGSCIGEQWTSPEMCPTDIPEGGPCDLPNWLPFPVPYWHCMSCVSLNCHFEGDLYAGGVCVDPVEESDLCSGNLAEGFCAEEFGCEWCGEYCRSEGRCFEGPAGTGMGTLTCYDLCWMVGTTEAHCDAATTLDCEWCGEHCATRGHCEDTEAIFATMTD